jgi:hypothetical protein
MGQRARIKELRRRAVALALAAAPPARLAMVHELLQHGIFNARKAREVLDLPRDSTT